MLFLGVDAAATLGGSATSATGATGAAAATGVNRANSSGSSSGSDGTTKVVVPIVVIAAAVAVIAIAWTVIRRIRKRKAEHYGLMTQQFRLVRHRQFTDLIEENTAVIRFFEQPALFSSLDAGNRPFFITEQFTF